MNILKNIIDFFNYYIKYLVGLPEDPRIELTPASQSEYKNQRPD